MKMKANLSIKQRIISRGSGGSNGGSQQWQSNQSSSVKGKAERKPAK